MRDWDMVKRDGELGGTRVWKQRACLLPHSCIQSPRRWGVQGGAFPDRSHLSEESGGKIFKRAMKAGPAPNNIWSLVRLGQLKSCYVNTITEKSMPDGWYLCCLKDRKTKKEGEKGVNFIDIN